MKKAETIIATLLFATTITAVAIPIVNKQTNGKVLDGFNNWLNGSSSSKDEVQRKNLITIDCRNEITNGALRNTGFSDFLNEKAEKEIFSHATTNKTTKDNGGIKFGTSDHGGYANLEFEDSYTFNRAKIIGRNYSTFQNSTKKYSLDKGGIKVNNSEYQYFTTNENDRTKLPPIEEKVFEFDMDQFYLNIKSVESSNSRIVIYQIELWTVDQPELSDFEKAHKNDYVLRIDKDFLMPYAEEFKIDNDTYVNSQEIPNALIYDHCNLIDDDISLYRFNGAKMCFYGNYMAFFEDVCVGGDYGVMKGYFISYEIKFIDIFECLNGTNFNYETDEIVRLSFFEGDIGLETVELSHSDTGRTIKRNSFINTGVISGNMLDIDPDGYSEGFAIFEYIEIKLSETTFDEDSFNGESTNAYAQVHYNDDVFRLDYSFFESIADEHQIEFEPIVVELEHSIDFEYSLSETNTLFTDNIAESIFLDGEESFFVYNSFYLSFSSDNNENKYYQLKGHFIEYHNPDSSHKAELNLFWTTMKFCTHYEEFDFTLNTKSYGDSPAIEIYPGNNGVNNYLEFSYLEISISDYPFDYNEFQSLLRGDA